VVTADEQRRRWAYALTSRCDTPPPSYGSPEWLALPDGPEKVAAVVIAAECWAFDGDHLEQTLRAELEFSRHAHKAAEDAAYRERRDAHRATWTGRGFLPDRSNAQDIEREWEQWAGGEVA
jgi:hypothetical protein